MNYEPGDTVERRYGRGEAQFGSITGRVREGYDAWYVTTGMGMTYCDNGRDLRRLTMHPADPESPSFSKNRDSP